MSDPRLHQMEKAADGSRSRSPVVRKIVVYGDYESDGVTGASLLFLALRHPRRKVDCYIPTE